MIYTRTGQANIYRRFIGVVACDSELGALGPDRAWIEDNCDRPGRAGGEGILTAIRGDRKLPWIRPGQSDLRPVKREVHRPRVREGHLHSRRGAVIDVLVTEGEWTSGYFDLLIDSCSG